MYNKNSLFTNTLVISIGTIGTKLMTVILVPLYTMWLTPAQYGRYDLWMSFANLIIPVLTLQLEQTVFRAYFENNRFKVGYLKNSIFIILLFNIVFDLIYINIESTLLVFLFCAYINIMSLYNLLIEYVRGNGWIKTYSFSNICVNILFFLQVIIYLGILNKGLVGLFVASIISYVMVIMYIIFIIKIDISDNSGNMINVNLVKKQLEYSLPLIPNNIGFWIINLSDRFLVMLFLGSTMNGLYAVGAKIPTLFVTIYGAFSLAWQQEAISIHNKNSVHRYQGIFHKVMIGTFGIIIVVVPFLQIMYKILINIRYQNSIYVVPILLYGTFLLCLSQFLSGMLIAKKSTSMIGGTTIIAAVVNLILNLLFLKKFGIVFAAWTTVVAYFLMFLLRILSLRKQILNLKNIVTFFVLTLVYLFVSASIYLDLEIYTLISQIIVIFGIIIITYKKIDKILGVLLNERKK